jgi:hypothetical protein
MNKLENLILENILEDFFAVFVIAEDESGLFAATTRCSDRGECISSYGFPGGKIDPNETLREAAVRESKEEGFVYSKVEEEPFYVDTVQGKRVAWLKGYGPKKLSSYKEQHRLKNEFVEVDRILDGNPEFKNKEAFSSYNKLLKQ